MAKFGQIRSDTEMDAMKKAAVDPDLAAQVVVAVEALTGRVAHWQSTQDAIDNIVADLNDLKAKLRTAGVLGVPAP